LNPKVLITKQGDDKVLEYLSNYCDYTIVGEKEPISRTELLRCIGQYDGLITTKEKIDFELLEHATNLKIVSNIAVGYDNFKLRL
jgi:gluconate 2-dehydrogenase